MVDERQIIRSSALSTFEIATGCSDHRNDSIAAEELGEVLFYGDNGADEFESVAIFRTADGSGYIATAESSDYTGHG